MIGKDGRRWVRLVVYVFLQRGGKILLGKRKNTFGAGHYSPPAGHIDPGETVFECAKRELLEETGIHADEFEFIGVRIIPTYEINDVKAHEYVAFAVRPKLWKGEPKLMEPEKNEGWEWHPIDAPPEPMFPPVPMMIECIKNSMCFID